jgi:hypothetical protein
VLGVRQSQVTGGKPARAGLFPDLPDRLRFVHVDLGVAAGWAASVIGDEYNLLYTIFRAFSSCRVRLV